jgi:hypothetical protein
MIATKELEKSIDSMAKNCEKALKESGERIEKSIDSMAKNCEKALKESGERIERALEAAGFAQKAMLKGIARIDTRLNIFLVLIFLDACWTCWSAFSEACQGGTR